MDRSGEFIIIVYVLLSIINVSSLFNKTLFIFRITKPLLMPALLGFYITSSSTNFAQIFFALFFAWLGDVLLLIGDFRKDKRAETIYNKFMFTLTLAGMAFILCHMLYAWIFYSLRSPIILWILGIVMIIYILFGIFVYIGIVRDFCSIGTFMKLAIGIYTFFILLMSYSSIFLINIQYLITFFPFVGSVFFIMSDYILAIGYKTTKSSTYQPWVMASYLTAQFLIIYGLVLLGG